MNIQDIVAGLSKLAKRFRTDAERIQVMADDVLRTHGGLDSRIWDAAIERLIASHGTKNFPLLKEITTAVTWARANAKAPRLQDMSTDWMSAAERTGYNVQMAERLTANEADAVLRLSYQCGMRDDLWHPDVLDVLMERLASDDVTPEHQRRIPDGTHFHPVECPPLDNSKQQIVPRLGCTNGQPSILFVDTVDKHGKRHGHVETILPADVGPA